MENWIIHYDANYDAVPWPFVKSWDEFTKAPEPLRYACDDFGRAAPCDGLSETPAVPPRLPRLKPHGNYRMAVYYDADWLYAFLETENTPVIVPAAELARIPRLQGVNPRYPVLALLTTDGKFIYQFGLNSRSEPHASIAAVNYGARKPAVPARKFDWELVTIARPTGELACWRIARSALMEAFRGDTLQVSLSRLAFEALEAVAWGSHTTWGPRPDEFGTVRLVEKRETPAWPVARRVEMLYEPLTEQARLRVHWAGIYQPAEADTQVYPDKAQRVPWRQWSLRVNGEQRLFDLCDEAETPEFPLVDGHNHLDIASAGGPAVRLVVEKWSGNRIAPFGVRQLAAAFSEPPAKRQPAAALQSSVRDRLRTECDRAIAALEARRTSGEKLAFVAWDTYHAASIGRMYHYLDRDPRLLEVLREQADFALTLQRDDGSFAGFHLEHYGHKPGPWRGGAFDTGPAGELWAVAAWLLKDPKYLAASTRLLHAYQGYQVEFNYNYAAFTLYHLATHYRLTREPAALGVARHYCRHCVATDLTPMGFQAGHNYYTCYGSITLRGIANFCAVLPERDPYRVTLREQCIRMTNQVLSRQQPDGSFDGRNRFFLDQRWWSWGLFSAAFLLSPDDVARLDEAIQRLLHYAGNSQGMNRLAESDFIRYWAHRDALLTGKPIDLLGLI